MTGTEIKDLVRDAPPTPWLAWNGEIESADRCALFVPAPGLTLADACAAAKLIITAVNLLTRTPTFDGGLSLNHAISVLRRRQAYVAQRAMTPDRNGASRTRDRDEARAIATVLNALPPRMHATVEETP